MTSLQELCDDLRDEHSELDLLLVDLADPLWDRPTPAEGWSVRDQVSHLAFFDEQAALAVADPEGFAASLERAAGDIPGFMDGPLEKGRAMDPEEVLAWWRWARSEMLEAFERLSPGERVPWFGPPMSPASFISARLMETWAHGQDIFDATDVTRRPTDRLRHIAFLGARARRFSYVTNGLPEPDGEVRVELTLPSGAPWEFGDSDENVVRGSALDFCLVVTQRRHLDDTSLEISGPLAEEWMSIAQCFAGPPGSGREPGQFS